MGIEWIFQLKKKNLYFFKSQKKYLMKFWKFSRLNTWSRQSQQGKNYAGKDIVVAKIIEITEHLEKHLVSGTGQVADAEKDYTQESTT